MFGIRTYIAGAVAAALVAAAVWVMLLINERDRLRAEVASQALTIQSLKQAAEQSRLAADVAKAAADRERARAAEYDALREALIGGNEDAELPQWFRDYLVSLGVIRLPDNDTD